MCEVRRATNKCWLYERVTAELRLMLRRSAILFGLLAVIVGYCIFFPVWNNGYWFIAALLIFTYLLMRKFDKEDERSFRPLWGWRLEQRIAKDLQHLPNDYVLVRNWDAGRGDIDAILFGPHGALVIEAKNYAAPQVCRGKSWFYVKSGREILSRKNPITQTERGNMTLRETLQSLGYKCYVRSVIVMAEPSRFEAHEPAIPVVRRSELVAHVQGLDKGTNHSAEELADALLTGRRLAA